MTVCVAAICGQPDAPAVVGASDRLVTWNGGLLVSQPARRKVVTLNERVVAMGAGDAEPLDIILPATAEVARREHAASVADVSTVLYQQFLTLRRRRAEDRYLRPRGLDYESLHWRRPDQVPNFDVRELLSAVASYRLGTRILVAGTDESGAHIYRVSDEGVISQDVGFSAIGTGEQHAERWLILNGFQTTLGIDEALLSVHIAKKRSEVASNVGPTTDLFVITDRYVNVSDGILEELGEVRRQVWEEEARIWDRARDRFRAYCTENFVDWHREPSTGVPS